MTVDNNVSRMASLYQTALETSGLGNVSVEASEDGKSLTVTVRGADGSVTGTDTIAIPDIDVPAGGSVGDSAELTEFINSLNGAVKSLANLDDAAFDELEKNVKSALEKTAEELGAVQSGGTSSSGKTSALYCIYKLMSLMLEVAREQREVARQTREADTQMMLKTMESQRQAMISEAITGMVCCSVVAGLQLGMVGLSAYKSSAVETSRKDASRVTGDKTFKHVAGMAAESGNPQALDTAKTKAETTLNAAVEDFVKESKLPAEERPAAQQEIDQRFSAIEELTDEQVKGEGHLNNPNATQQEINDYKAQQRTAVYEQAKTERAAVKERFLKAEDEGTLDDKLRREMDLANAKVEYAAACKLDAEAQPGKAPSADMANEFKALANDDSAKASNERRSTFADEIAQKQYSAQRTDQVTNVFATLFKGLVDHGLTLQKAENRKYDQTVELEKEKLDSTKDLVQNSLEMFKQMLSVLNSIAESEKSTFREIMG